MYPFDIQHGYDRLASCRRQLVCMAALSSGLLVSLLTVQPATSQTAELDSGVASSQFELLLPDEGEPPRPAPMHGSMDANEEIASGPDQELSVEPSSPPLLPADAPAWVGAPANTSGDMHYLYVCGQIADSESEAAELIDDELVVAVCNYVDHVLLDTSANGRNRWELSRDLDAADRLTGRAAEFLRKKVNPDFIWKNMVDDPTGYMARLNTSGIPMFQKWVTVSITPEQRAMILRWDREATQSARLAPVGVGVLGLLGSVALAHLIIKGRKPRP